MLQINEQIKGVETPLDPLVDELKQIGEMLEHRMDPASSREYVVHIFSS